MKNSKKILSILALSPLFIASLVAVGGQKEAKSVGAGILYENNGETTQGAAISTEVPNDNGNKAWLLTGTASNISIALTGANAPVAGNENTLSMKVKGTAGETFKAGLTLTLAKTAGGYEYATLWAPEVTLTGEWQDVSLVLGIGINDTGTFTFYEGGFNNPTKSTTTTAAVTKVANVNMMFKLTEGQTAYVDDYKIETKIKPLDYTGAAYFNDFEEGASKGSPYGPVELSSKAYDGTHSLVGPADTWVGDVLENDAAAFMGDGNFYKFVAMVRAEADGNTTTTSPFVQLQYWSCDSNLEDGWAAVNSRFTLHHWDHYGTYADWTLISSEFCFYNGADGAYGYSSEAVNAGFEQLAKNPNVPAGQVYAPMVRIEMEGTNKVSLLYDNVAFLPITKTKDAVLTVDGVSGASVEVWKDGAKLATQPQIQEDQGVFTVKDLVFANVAEEYELKVMSGGQEVASRTVSYIKNTALFAQYDATLTIKDKDGNPITDAVVTMGEETITENTNGVFSFNDLTDAISGRVDAEGYIGQTFEIDISNKDVTLTLRKPEAVAEHHDNLLDNGGVETTWNYNDEGGNQVKTERVDADSADGSYALKLTANAEGGRSIYRVVTGAAFVEKEYRVEAMVKAANAQTTQMNLGGFWTCTTDGGWAYLDATGSWATISQSEWTLVSMTFKVTLDELESKAYISVNGGEPVVREGIVTFAAFDLRIGMAHLGDEILIDDMAIYELFDAKVNVIKDGEESKAATFQVTDNRGNTTSPNVAYDTEEQAYVLKGLYSEVTVVASAGGETFSAVKINKDLAESNIEISKAYKITLTLVADTGEKVTGAIVKAVKGLTEVGTFTEVGDGVYELDGVMGDVQVTVNKTGYDFDKKLVTSSTATLTLTGTNLNPPQPEPQKDDGKKGCGGSIVVASALVSTVALIGAGLLAGRKKED